MTPTASRVADRSVASAQAAGIRQPGGALVSVHEAPATTHEAIELVDRKGGASSDKIRVCFQQVRDKQVSKQASE